MYSIMDIIATHYGGRGTDKVGTSPLSRNDPVMSDTEAEVPLYGFASSPLVTGDLVIVAAAGRLAAYDQQQLQLEGYRRSSPGRRARIRQVDR